MDIVASRLLKQAVPLFSALAICLLILAVSTILYFGQEIFVPFALGILLSFMLAPIVNALQKMHVPKIAAVGIAVFGAFVAIMVLGFVIVSQLSSLATEIPRYAGTLGQKVQSIAAAGASESDGPIGRAVSAIERVAADVQGAVAGEEGAEAGTEAQNSGTEANPIAVRIENQSGPLSTALAVLGPVIGPIGTLGIVIVFAIFILLQREDLRNRLIRLAGTDDLQQTTAAIDDAARRLGRLLLFQLAVN
ncbi:AI-2E family transporter, partial [Fulvimarina endophytica]